jgi:geranylgeranyl diphosphate synthase, type I
VYDEIGAQANSFAGLLNATFEEALAEFVRTLPSHRDLVDYATRTGHRTRPVGCLLAADAVGGDWRSALDAALCVELIHKSSVIRDDIADEDSVRSGQPAFHVAYGVPRAITVSDLLWTLGLKQTLELPPAVTRSCVEALAEMSAGQLEDVAPSLDRGSTEDRRLVEEQKTGVLAELACRLGALTGGGEPEQVAALARYGRNLGTAFQIFNDVRNLRGEEPERSAASDLRKRRDTILSAYAREAGEQGEADGLGALPQDRSDLPEDQVRSLQKTILSSGATDFGVQTAMELMEEARTQLNGLDASLARDILKSLTEEALLSYAF